MSKRKYWTNFIGASKIGGNGWAIIHGVNVPAYTKAYDTLKEAEESVREIRETGIYKMIEEEFRASFISK